MRGTHESGFDVVVRLTRRAPVSVRSLSARNRAARAHKREATSGHRNRRGVYGERAFAVVVALTLTLFGAATRTAAFDENWQGRSRTLAWRLRMSLYSDKVKYAREIIFFSERKLASYLATTQCQNTSSQLSLAPATPKSALVTDSEAPGHSLTVECGALVGSLDLNSLKVSQSDKSKKRKLERIVYDGVEYSGGQFEQLAGKGSRRDWKKSCRVVQPGATREEWISVRQWLAENIAVQRHPENKLDPVAAIADPAAAPSTGDDRGNTATVVQVENERLQDVEQVSNKSPVPSIFQAHSNRQGLSSQYRGVSWCKGLQKWRAQLPYAAAKHKQRHLGYFREEVDAALAFDRGVREVSGAEAAANFSVHEADTILSLKAANGTAAAGSGAAGASQTASQDSRLIGRRVECFRKQQESQHGVLATYDAEHFSYIVRYDNGNEEEVVLPDATVTVEGTLRGCPHFESATDTAELANWLPPGAVRSGGDEHGCLRWQQFQEALVLSESVAQVAEQLEWLEAEILITSAEWQGHSREQWASTVAQLQEHGAEHGEAGEEASAEQLRRLVTELKNGVAQEMVEKLWDLWDTRGQDACHAAVKRFLKHGHVAEARPPLEPKQAFDNLPSGTHHGDNKDEHSGLLTVECGELEGVLDLDTLKITYDGLELAGGQFERMAGKGSRKVWKKSCRVVEPNVPREEWISVWQWLEENLRQNQQHEQGAEATTATAEAPCYNDDEDDADDYQAAKRQRVAPVRYRAGSGGTQGRGRRPMLPPGGLTDDSDMSAQDVGVATLAALGLAQNAELSPDGRDGTTDTLEMAMAMAMAQASQSADQSPGKRILVECGSLIGKLDVATLKIMYDGREVSGGQFERLAGKGSRKVWKKSCRVVEPNVPREEWITVRQWLADNGFAQADAPASGAVGDAVVVANLTNPTAFRKPKSRKPTEGVQVSKLQSADARPKATLSRDSALHGTRDDEGNGQLVVECGELEGVLDLDTLKITYDGLELAGGQFERLAGKGSRKVWKKSCRVVQQQVPREEWISVWQWLEENQRRNAPEPRAEAATEPQWSIDKEAQEQANAQARRSRLASRNRDGLGAEESWGCGGAEDDTMQQVMEMAEVMGSWRSVGPSSDRPPKLEPEPEGTVAQRLETASLPPGLKFEKNHAKPTKYLLGRFQTEMQQAQANDEAAKAQSNSTAEVKPLELRPTERSEGTTTCEREGKDGSEASRTAGLLQAAPMQTERSAASEQSAPAVLSSRKGLSSQYLGVSWCEELQKWRAQLPYAAAKHKQRHLGYFREEVDAALAFDRGVREVSGAGVTANFSVHEADTILSLKANGMAAAGSGAAGASQTASQDSRLIGRRVECFREQQESQHGVLATYDAEHFSYIVRYDNGNEEEVVLPDATVTVEGTLRGCPHFASAQDTAELANWLPPGAVRSGGDEHGCLRWQQFQEALVLSESVAQVAEQLEWLEAEILITSAEWQGHSRERWVSTVVQLQEQDVEQGVSEEASAEQLRRLVTELKVGLAEEMVEKLWELWDTRGLDACHAAVKRFLKHGHVAEARPLPEPKPGANRVHGAANVDVDGSVLTVECGELQGVLDVSSLRITYDGMEVGGGQFERLAGRGSRRDWKKSCRVVQPDEPREAWVSVRQWLAESTTPSGQAERRPTSGPSKDPAGKARSFQASPPIEQTDMLKHVLEMAEVMGSWRAAGPHPEVKQDSQMEQQANVDQDSEMEQQNDVDQDSEMEQQAFTDQDSEMEQRGTAYEEPKPDEVKALKAEAEKCSLIATQSKPDTKQESKVSREGQQLPEVERTCPKMTTAAPGLKFEKNHAKPTKYLLGRFQTEMQQAQANDEAAKAQSNSTAEVKPLELRPTERSEGTTTCEREGKDGSEASRTAGLLQAAPMQTERSAASEQSAPAVLSSRKGLSSQYLGVSWCEELQKWRAQLPYAAAKHKQRHLGYFREEVDAALAFDRGVREVSGAGVTANFSVHEADTILSLKANGMAAAGSGAAGASQTASQDSRLIGRRVECFREQQEPQHGVLATYDAEHFSYIVRYDNGNEEEVVLPDATVTVEGTLRGCPHFASAQDTAELANWLPPGAVRSGGDEHGCLRWQQFQEALVLSESVAQVAEQLEWLEAEILITSAEWQGHSRERWVSTVVQLQEQDVEQGVSEEASAEQLRRLVTELKAGLAEEMVEKLWELWDTNGLEACQASVMRFVNAGNHCSSPLGTQRPLEVDTTNSSTGSLITVECGGLTGVLNTNCMRITYDGKNVTGSHFERLAGRGSRRDWKKSCRVVQSGDPREAWISVRQWLVENNITDMSPEQSAASVLSAIMGQPIVGA
ncbi:hypothetical protein CYMTET_21606 [Cymbomonas tetramitiformis]|uniref:AP2/ERF domain-containing protein n=1 Tax=Cymbomonas tetramitiformis TaxID=36881 RepID=A0AAE0L2T2_9CHLO|nr:hypothetical protein CYMTET_21606 [Cymbomonas tetramitiformis]